MKTSMPYDPENPFHAAVASNGSTRNLPSSSRSSRQMQDVSLNDNNQGDNSQSKNANGEIDNDDDETNKKDFEDLAATGKWGSVSRKEVICVASTVILVLAGVIVAIVLLVGGNNGTKAGAGLSEAPSMAPSMPTNAFVSAMDEYVHLKQALKLNVYTSEIDLPKNSSYLRALSQYDDDAYISAAAWLMFKDPANMIDGMVERFAVASLYYAWKGDEWDDYSKWLMPELHVCDWTGVSCGVNEKGSKVVTELTLPNNNLVGTIPPTLSMLTELAALRLGDNYMTGKLPGAVFGSLEKLGILELQNNDFTGQFPYTLRGPKLDSIHVEGNEFHGTWAFCGAETLTNFTLDCKLLGCSCCDTSTNCKAVV